MTSLQHSMIAAACKFDELSDDVVIKIFDNLNAKERILIERVCKRWKFLSMDSWSKFRRLETSSLPNISVVFEKVLSRCGTYLKTIICKYNVAEPENILSLVAKSCPYLVKFSFTGSTFPNIDFHLSNIFRNCPRLTTLELSENRKLTGSCFVDLPQELKCLVLNYCWLLKNEYIQIIACRCLNLEVLDLSKCDQLSMACLQFVFKRLTKLRVLKICSCFDVEQPLQPSLALSYLSQLIEIDLCDMGCVNDETLKVISRSCLHINEIDVSDCYGITDTGLFQLVNLKDLIRLNLSSCLEITDIGVKSLAKLSSLEVLNLHMCKNVTDDSVIKIAYDCPKLTELDLRYTSVTYASVQAFYNNADEKKAELVLFVKSASIRLQKFHRYRNVQFISV